jgi:sigma-B regulation protein RsbQ
VQRLVSSQSVLRRNNVTISGARDSANTMVLVHGYGCDQAMWRSITPAFASDYRLVLPDLVGYGHSDHRAYDRVKYETLDGHATDLLEICEALEIKNSIIVGHSVSAIIAVLAANRSQDSISRIVLVSPSPSYINDGDYIGGFTRADIEGLLEVLDANYLGWSKQMAPIIMGVPDRPELSDELTNSFCRTDPEVAKHFARVTFLSDHRADVAACTTPGLILQCSSDVIAPVEVGAWLNRAMIDSDLVVMEATGHCPHMSAPEETIAAMKGYLAKAGLP